jgi:hypothetical protein
VTLAATSHLRGGALYVGTEKGLFRIECGHDGTPARFDGPYLAGYRVLHVVSCPQRPREMLAAVDHPVWGAHLYRGCDGDAHWTSLAAVPHHPPGRHCNVVDSIWHLAWSPQGGTLYAGIDPAGLFTSEDGGANWCDVPSLNEHETRKTWEPSRGLFALHSICVDRGDPKHIVVAISAGGVYRSTDGGATWCTANVGVRAEHLPERYPAAGHNVHRVVMHPRDGRRLYRQCYNGTYRSDDGGATWTEITAGLPSDFGYAIACDPENPDFVLQIPEVSSHLRIVVDGRLRVFRSDDAGRRWHSASSGLPQQHAYVTVLRDALAADAAAPGRFAFGTSSGHVFLTDDHGDTWRQIAEFLPRVTAVHFVASGGPNVARG